MNNALALLSRVSPASRAADDVYVLSAPRRGVATGWYRRTAARVRAACRRAGLTAHTAPTGDGGMIVTVTVRRRRQA